MPTRHERFSQTDAWIFASLRSDGSSTLLDIVRQADLLAHALPTHQEILGALEQLGARGLVASEAQTFTLTPAGARVYASGIGRRGGLFAIVDNMLKALNSPRLKAETLRKPGTEAIELAFVTPEQVTAAEHAYQQLAAAARAAANPQANTARHLDNASDPSAARPADASELDCLTCGACCRQASDGRILIPSEDLLRWQRAGRTDILEQVVPGHFGEMAFAFSDEGACVHLGTPASQHACRIYADRGTTCREFEKGSWQCHEFRRDAGLEPKRRRGG